MTERVPADEIENIVGRKRSVNAIDKDEEGKR